MNEKTFDVPRKWKETHLKEIAKIKSGSTPSRAQHERYFVDGKIPWVKTMDLTNGPITQTDECITELAIEETSCSILEPETVLVAMYGGFNQIGRTGIMTFEGSINQAISSLTINKEKALPEYVLNWLNSNISLWRRFAASSRKDPNITKKDVENFPILLPPLYEQHKIVEIIRSWDYAIYTTEQLIAKRTEFRRGLIQQLISGKRRFSEFKQKWRKVKLSQVLIPISRQEEVDPAKKYRLLGVRWYVAGAHIHDVVPGSQIATKVLNRVHENDVLYNKMWVTKSAFGIAQKEHNGSYGSNEYPQFRVQSDKLNVNFLGFVFFDKNFQHAAARMCKGTTGRARLNPSDFLKLEILIPDLSEQNKIADFLKTYSTDIELLNKKLAALKQQKKGLIQKLLTGQVRVKV